MTHSFKSFVFDWKYPKNRQILEMVTLMMRSLCICLLQSESFFPCCVKYFAYSVKFHHNKGLVMLSFVIFLITLTLSITLKWVFFSRNSFRFPLSCWNFPPWGSLLAMIGRHSGAVRSAGCVNVPLPTVHAALLWLSCSKPAESCCQDLSAFCTPLLPTLTASCVAAATAAVISASAGFGSKFPLKPERWTLPCTPDSGPTGAGQTNPKVNDQRSSTAAAARTRHSEVPPGTTCLCVAHPPTPQQLKSRVTFSMQSENGAFYWHPSVTAAAHHLSACVWRCIRPPPSSPPSHCHAGSLSQSCDTSRPRPEWAAAQLE